MSRQSYRAGHKNGLHLYLVHCQKSSFNQVRFACYAISYLSFNINFVRITRFVLHIVLLCHTYEHEIDSFVIRHSGVFQMNNLAFVGQC